MEGSGEIARPGSASRIREQLANDLVRSAYLVGDFVLSSGRRSRYYFDKYLFETKPQILRPLSRLLAQEIPPGVDRIAGPELGAVALATAVSLETGIPFVIVKKEPKEYATQKLVEGEIHAGERVVLIEDVLTTGTQAIGSAEKLRTLDVEVLLVLAIVDREEGARQNIEAAGFQLKTLFSRSELDNYLE